ncbi:MAG: oligoribonuclease [Candidatus Omnitrophica bacterium]|nr:oligoribonuclease [Candidatus Omnitrophota bacterium]MDD5670752.1 oligoribonuclease [Candidatus Omnitrophota bacterium]
MTKSAKSKDNMVWIDMEMTGLDPARETILEIATIITDPQLRIVAEGPSLVVRQPAARLRAMDRWNRTQHAKSGLIDEVKKSKISLKTAELKTLRFVKKYCPPKTAVLCGSSVHHDRTFLMKYMPKLVNYLHYRIVDVSSIKTLVKHWYPGTPEFTQKKDSHRALCDIRESIEELKFFRKHYFK